jgi:molecular chaperone GrpE
MSHKKKHTEPQDQQPAMGPEDASGAEAPAAVPDLDAELQKAQAAAAESEDRYLRAQAEVENIRRRGETEVANARKYAIERFASELLAVKDSLELAEAVNLEHDNKDAVEKMFEGIELTLKLMGNVFEKFEIQEVNPAPGDKFDPERHQAMSTLESAEVAPNHVVNTVQKGYLLNDRLLRPAMVMVAKASSQQDRTG